MEESNDHKRRRTTNKGEHKTKERDKNTHRRLVLDPQCCCGRLLMGPMGSQMVWAPLPSKVSHEVDIFVRLFVPHIFGCRFASVNDLARSVLPDEYFQNFLQPFATCLLLLCCVGQHDGLANGLLMLQRQISITWQNAAVDAP